MDMVYHLPFRDWLEVEKAHAPSELPAPEAPQNEGSGG